MIEQPDGFALPGNWPCDTDRLVDLHRANYRARYKPKTTVVDGVAKTPSGSTWHQWMPIFLLNDRTHKLTGIQMDELYAAGYKPSDAVKAMDTYAFRWGAQ